MKTRSICFSILLCLCGICTSQQVVSSGGHLVKHDYSLNWILGGSLSTVLVDQAASVDIKRESPAGNIVAVKVYPSPAHDFLKIEITPNDTGRLMVGLFNTNGIKIMSRIIPFEPVMEINLSDVLPGTYLLKITKPAGEYMLFETKKIIKN